MQWSVRSAMLYYALVVCEKNSLTLSKLMKFLFFFLLLPTTLLPAGCCIHQSSKRSFSVYVSSWYGRWRWMLGARVASIRFDLSVHVVFLYGKWDKLSAETFLSRGIQGKVLGPVSRYSMKFCSSLCQRWPRKYTDLILKCYLFSDVSSFSIVWVGRCFVSTLSLDSLRRSLPNSKHVASTMEFIRVQLVRHPTTQLILWTITLAIWT